MSTMSTVSNISNMSNSAWIRRFGRSVVATAVASFAIVGVARAELPEVDSQTLARVEDFARVLRAISQRVEPATVKIDSIGVATGVRNSQSELFRRLFPDNDGDGRPDVPPGFDFNFGEPDSTTPRRLGEGSGVVMDHDDGKAFVLTNNHVVNGATQIRITFADGRVVDDAKLVGADPRSDLAVLEVAIDKAATAEWGDSTTLQKRRSATSAR
jgi:S1-C subfamily serine protease